MVMANPWDFMNLPATLGSVSGMGTLVAGFMLTAGLAMLFVLPAMFARQKPDIVIALVIFAILIATGLNWIPSGIMVVLIFIVALAWAGVFRRVVAG